MKRIAVSIVLLLVVCALDAANAATKKSRAGGDGPEIGQAAPEITGKDLEGKPMKLSEFRGKVVVLDFWAFW